MEIRLAFSTSKGNSRWVVDRLSCCFVRSGHEVHVFDSPVCGSEPLGAYVLFGIVYPVWGSALPAPLQSLAASLPRRCGRAVFLVGTAGAFSGDTGIHWKSGLEEHGYDVVYADHVSCPSTACSPARASFLHRRTRGSDG